MNEPDLEQAVKAMQNFGDAMQNFGEHIVKVFTDTFVSIGEQVKHIYGIIYDVYLNAGAPYGESDEGFMQWLEEAVEQKDSDHHHH